MTIFLHDNTEPKVLALTQIELSAEGAQISCVRSPEKQTTGKPTYRGTVIILDIIL